MEREVRCFGLYIGIVVILFFSASISSFSLEVDSIQNKLKGDWVSEYFQGFLHETVFLLSFKEEECLFLSPTRNLKKYRLSNDTLIVTEIIERSLWDTRNPIVHSYYKILSLNEDKLLLKVILDTTHSSIKYYYKAMKTDTIAFQRLVKKNNLIFERLAFYCNSSFCESCPDMYLEIDNTGKIKFNGKNETGYEGFFDGRIPLNKINNLYEKIYLLNLSNLDKKYSASWTDDQTCGILIQTKDTTFVTSVYGFYKEPPELRILINYLTNLYLEIDLKENPKLEGNFVFQQFHDEAFPYIPAVPMPDDGIELTIEDFEEMDYLDNADIQIDSTFEETSRRNHFKLLGIPYFSFAEEEIKLVPNCELWSFKDTSIVYPILRGSEVKEKINEILNNDLKSYFEYDSNLSIEQTLNKMIDECIVGLAYQLYIDTNYMSVKLDLEWAGPSSHFFSKYFTFSLEDGRRIGLIDLVENNEEFLLYVKKKQIEHLEKFQTRIKLEFEKGDLDIYTYNEAIKLTDDNCFIENWTNNFIIYNDAIEIDINCGFPKLTEAFAPYDNLYIPIEELDNFK